MSRLSYKYPYPVTTRSEYAWRSKPERQRIKDRHARTLGRLPDEIERDEIERDEEACKVIYVTQPAEREKSFTEAEKEAELKRAFRALADKLCEEHPAISTDKGIFGGMPHIKNVRLSVGDILAQLYIYGGIEAVLNIYAPDVTEEQVKEAIAYAQDFLETACAPR